MYIALKTHISFESEVQSMSDLKNDVVAECWAMLIKERMESGMTVREWCHDRNIKESRYYLLLVENTPQEGSGKYRTDFEWVKKHHGEVTLDNNATESTLRGFCIGKHNWRRIDTIRGVRSSTIIYSIKETAKANNLKVYEYVEYLLTEIPKHEDDTNLNFLYDLLPWFPNLPERCRKCNKV